MKAKIKKKQPKPPRRPTVMQRTDTFGNIELRYKNAELDEVVVVDETGKCILHMEWLHDNTYWMGLYGTKKDGTKVDVNVEFGSESRIRFRVR